MAREDEMTRRQRDIERAGDYLRRAALPPRVRWAIRTLFENGDPNSPNYPDAAEAMNRISTASADVPEEEPDDFDSIKAFKDRVSETAKSSFSFVRTNSLVLLASLDHYANSETHVDSVETGISGVLLAKTQSHRDDYMNEDTANLLYALRVADNQPKRQISISRDRIVRRIELRDYSGADDELRLEDDVRNVSLRGMDMGFKLFKVPGVRLLVSRREVRGVQDNASYMRQFLTVSAVKMEPNSPTER